MGFFDKILHGLTRTRQTVSREIQAVFRKGKLTDEAIEALEEKLLAADIGWDTAHLILDGVRKRARGQEIDQDQLLAWMAEEAKNLLGGAHPSIINAKPHVILFVGVNGAGKTTSLAKVAHHFATRGRKVLLAACDTFRAGAISQLDVWAQRAGVEVVKHQEGSDAASVAYDAYTAAKARGCDLMLVDTAGRLHTKDNLMEELRKLVRVLRKHDPSLPHETLLVIDGNTGQNALPQFKGFFAAVPLNGLVVTKLDGTAKGGSVLSLSREFGVPVRWVGVGEGLDDLIPFDPGAYAHGLFGP
jgi:fused signal recognition particle receptor